MSDVPLDPLCFAPIFKSAIWGGRLLAELFPGAPPEGTIAETWVLSDQGENSSLVSHGPLRGTSLRRLMESRRAELLGTAHSDHDHFPLLLKYIDARENLSVQVHPDDELARTLASVPRGKTEAWIVLHAEPGSRIFAGLRHGVGRGELEQAIAHGAVDECLHSFEARAGQCVFLPAGTVHALGAGITVFEIQQTSDTTYRLFDWNRVDKKTGKPRDLHVEKALACTNFDQGPVRPTEPVAIAGPGESCRAIECPYFLVRHTTLTEPAQLEPSPKCRILLPLRGSMTVEHGPSQTDLVTNTVVLVPAMMPIACLPNERVSFLDIVPQ